MNTNLIIHIGKYFVEKLKNIDNDNINEIYKRMRDAGYKINALLFSAYFQGSVWNSSFRILQVI